MNVFYTPFLSKEIIILDESESLHAIKVLRLNSGDHILVMDGKGIISKAEIIKPHPKKCECKLLERNTAEKRPFHIHLAIAPTKLNDRMEWLLEKVTEIGVEEITPVICARSERRKINSDRFEKVLIASMKQSLNPFIPVLREPEIFDNFVSNSASGYIAHCNDTPRIPLKNADIDKRDTITILIGPEGDFTPAEVQLAVNKNWIPVSLGDNRLRTETAGMVACHTITLLKT